MLEATSETKTRRGGVTDMLGMARAAGARPPAALRRTEVG